jgi:hypothetical protein
MKEVEMGILREIAAFFVNHLLVYSFTAFILFTIMVSLIGGICDTVYASQAKAAEDRWALEAAGQGEIFVRGDYTANVVTGAVQFVLFACTVLLGIRLFGRKTGRIGFTLLAVATAITAFVFLLPRAPIGTASNRMKEIYAFLTLLGIVDLSAYQGFLRQDDRQSEDIA